MIGEHSHSRAAGDFANGTRAESSEPVSAESQDFLEKGLALFRSLMGGDGDSSRSDNFHAGAAGNREIDAFPVQEPLAFPDEVREIIAFFTRQLKHFPNEYAHFLKGATQALQLSGIEDDNGR